MVQGIKQTEEGCLSREYSIYSILIAMAVKSAFKFNPSAIFFETPQGEI